MLAPDNKRTENISLQQLIDARSAACQDLLQLFYGITSFLTHNRHLLDVQIMMFIFEMRTQVVASVLSYDDYTAMLTD